MPRPLDEQRRRVPEDWGLPHSYHGFTRNHVFHDYIVQIRVRKQVIQVARVKDAKLAAQIYDVALWKLSPFIAACSKPNFPNEFSSITQEDVNNLCPLANQWYDRALKQIEASGIQLESLIEAKAQQLSRLTVDLAEDAKTDYASLMRLVQDMHNQAITFRFKFTNRRSRVGLVKFPEVTKCVDDTMQALTSLGEKSSKLLGLLLNHEELFTKLRSL